jgi:hypothetical protein
MAVIIGTLWYINYNYGHFPCRKLLVITLEGNGDMNINEWDMYQYWWYLQWEIDGDM